MPRPVIPPSKQSTQGNSRCRKTQSSRSSRSQDREVHPTKKPGQLAAARKRRKRKWRCEVASCPGRIESTASDFGESAGLDVKELMAQIYYEIDAAAKPGFDVDGGFMDEDDELWESLAPLGSVGDF